MKICYHVFQLPNYWRTPMKIFMLITELQLLLFLIAIAVVFYLMDSMNSTIITLTLTGISVITYFVLEHLGWRTGELEISDDRITFKGETPIEIPKSSFVRFDQTETRTFTSWYSYHIVELESKKYDVKIKCSKKLRTEITELLREFEQQ